MAQQIEIAVVGQVAEGIGITFRLVIQGERAFLGEGVGHLHPQSTGKALLSSGADIGEYQDSVLLPGFPHRLVEAVEAAVKAVWAVIDR